MHNVSQKTPEKANAYSNKSVQAPSPQLALPTGPVTLLRGGRHERTDEDRQWYSKQLAAEHTKLTDKVVYERVSYYGSLNPERLAFPSVARVAREVLCSARTVQRALRRLEASGLIECLSREGGHSTARYRVLGRTVCAPGVTECHPRGDRESPEVLKEGKRIRTKINSFTVGVKSIDPSETEGPKKETVQFRLPFPEQKQEKAPPAPKAPEPVFEHPHQVALLFKLQRKLGYPADDEQAAVFDGFDHGDKKCILDKLLAEEQLAAVRGEVEAPPPKPRAPRAGAPISTAPKRAEPPPCVTGHRWTEAASDGVRNCVRCLAESPGSEGFEAIKSLHTEGALHGGGMTALDCH